MKNSKKLNVLVACESSGTVRDAFRSLGHNAWSCDLLPCDADPTYHVQGDALYVAKHPKLCWETGNVGWSWDLMIAHPPCTYLCNSGVRWLVWRRRPAMRMDYNNDRWEAMEKAARFFSQLWCADIPYIAVENPIMHKYARLQISNRIGAANARQTQLIQPWQFGHGETKATCLWLRNLPKLVPTDIVSGREGRVWKTPPGPLRWKIRSKTFEGIAKAMATQWSAHIIAEKQKGK